RTLALLVGLDIELDALPFVQALEPGVLDRGDVHEHVAPTVVRLDEAVAAFAIEELDDTRHCHRETPSPNIASPPAPTDGGSAGHSHIGESVGPPEASVQSADPPKGGGTS